MFKRSKFFLTAIAMMVITAIVFAGCGTSQKPLPNQPVTPRPGTTGTAPGTNTTPGNGTGGQSLSAIQAPATGSGVDTAKTISNQLGAVSGVKRAAVVVDGNVAIVGVQFTDGTGKATVAALQGSATPGAMPGMNMVPTPGNAGITAGRTSGLPGTQTQVNPINPAKPNTTTQNNAANRNSIMQNTTTNQGKTGATATTTADVKTLIANKVKAASPSISKVLVTTDVSMVDKLSTVSNTLNRDLKDVSNKIQTDGGSR